ncbi:phytanoyl-CoA dioxygenase family protein [Sphingomonas sp. 1P08PE]|uniref:phytanoyl-CoA dioxygenase family protein n=1 Tax=Sphingomonas sp. 1P08PE TaxID=554122 RepID=UPI00399F57A2
MTMPIDPVARWTAQLASDGWCIIPGALPQATIAALDADLADDFARTPFCQGGFYGETTKRFGRLLTRSPHAAALVQQRTILGIVEALLSPWCDTIQLNVTQAIAVHPGAPSQLPHRDQDMWRGPIGEIEYLVNVIWPLTPFTAENGATLVWPGSHGAEALAPPPATAPAAAAMQPGDALVFLGSTLHGAGANRSTDVRRGLVVGYALGWLKPYENQWLAYPPAIARHFPPDLAALVGYRQHRPNLGNYEGRCPSVLLDDAVPDHLAAIDALRPDQEEVMAAFLDDQRRAS